MTNVGSPALSITGTTLGGVNASDFVIAGDACTGRTLALWQSCTITAGFTADSTGAKTATITLSDTELVASTINLTGTGVAPNSGPTKSVVVGKRRHHTTVQRCTTQLTSSPIKFTTAARSARAVVSRNGIVYATGQAIRSGTHIGLVLAPAQRIPRGAYTLSLTHDHHTRTSRITIG